MAVAGYSEQEKIHQDQGEISHRLFTVLQRILHLLQVAGQQLYKTDVKKCDCTLSVGGVVDK